MGGELERKPGGSSLVHQTFERPGRPEPANPGKYTLTEQLPAAPPRGSGQPTATSWADSSHTAGPRPNAPQTADPQPESPQSPNSQTANPQTANPQTANPQAANPQTTGPQAAGPQAANPHTADSQTTNPQTANPHAGDSQTTNPQTANPQTPSPQIADPKPTAPQAASAQAENPQITTPQPAGSLQSGPAPVASQHDAAGPSAAASPGPSGGAPPQPGVASQASATAAHAASPPPRSVAGPGQDDAPAIRPGAGAHAPAGDRTSGAAHALTAASAHAPAGPAEHAAGHDNARGETGFEAGDIEGGHAEPPSPVATAAVEHQVHASAAAERAKISALLAQQCTEVDAHVARKHQEIAAAAQQHTARVRTSAQTARARATAEVTQAHARLRSDAQAKRQAIQTWHATSSARVADGVRTRQVRTRKLGDTHAASLNATANTAAQRAQTEVNAKAQQARTIGQVKAGATGPTADATDAKRKAANEISSDSASKIIGGLGTAVADIHQTGRETGSTLQQDANGAASQLGTAAPQVLAHLATQRDQAIQQIAQVEARSAQAITQTHNQIDQQITTTEQQQVHHLQSAQAAQTAQITQAGQRTVTTLRTEGTKALAAGDQSVAQIAGHVRRISIGLKQSKVIGDRLAGQIRQGFGSLRASVVDGGRQARTGLDHAATHAAQSFAPISQSATRSFGDLSSHVGTHLLHQIAQAGRQLDQVHTSCRRRATRAWIPSSTASTSRSPPLIRHSATRPTRSGPSSTSRPRPRRRKQVSRPPPWARIDEAHARIDAKAKESEKGWLERQFDSLVSMLTDPGFWAALVVGLVLAVVVIALLPAELTVGAVLLAIAGMAVVGALAAGVGTVVSNLCAGRPWDQNLGTNMLVGAVFGAALFAVGLLLPEGIAGYLGLAGTAGVLTVITNLATGRPWDEGLLANMALVGVLAWLGKFLPKGGGKPVPIEEPSKPPVPVNEPVKPNGSLPDPNKPNGPVETPNKPNGPVEDPNKPAGLEEKPAARRSMPEDLSKVRGSLTNDKAVRQFDAKYDQITKGSESPTAQQLDAFRAYLKSRGPSFDESLAADWEKAHPAPEPAKPPRGDAVQELAGIRDTVTQTRAALEALKAERPTLTGVDRLLSRLAQEEGMLNRMESGELPADMDAAGRPNVRGLKNNIDSIRAELRGAQNDPNATELGPKFDLGGKKIEIDRVTNNGKTWIDVKNYAPFDKGSANLPKLEAQARQTLELADANKVGNPPQPPELVWEFPRGVTRSVKAALEAISVNGRHVRVVGPIADPISPPLVVPPPPQDQDEVR